ncbi:MAG: signal peptide peptidase SppA [Ignavibacteriales bacterium]|nr:signal peptide peptidase SppA [Ignavibacteriales bacterium]
MSSTAKWVLGIVAGLLAFGAILVFLVVLTFMGDRDFDDSTSTSGEKVAVVDLKEPIMSSEETVRQFKKYRENKSVKAIVFRVESPGGGVSASQEIYEEVRKTRESGKPVVVSMGSVAASGGYYVSCGASRIVANPGTLTGSIGVIFQYLHAEELLAKLGIDAATYKTGRLKDAGSPFRKPSAEDKKFFDQLLGDVYDQFVDVVAHERKLDRKVVLKYADGRVFTGRQALEWGFVDTLGTYENAVTIAARLGGIDGTPKLIKERKRRSFWEQFWTEAAGDLKGIRDELFRQPIVQYKMNLP